MTAQPINANDELGGPSAAQKNLKQCGKCKQWKPATKENFSKNRLAKDGLYHWCKLCQQAHRKEHYQANRDRVGQTVEQWREANPERVLAISRAYYARNRAKRLDRQRAYREAHPEKIKEYRRRPEVRARKNEQRRLARAAARAERPPKTIPPNSKKCLVCQHYKPLDQFKPRSRNPDGLTACCVTCLERHRLYELSHPKPPTARPKKPPVILGPEYGKLVDAFLKSKGLRAVATVRHLKGTLYLFGQYLGDVWPVTEDEINGFIAECKGRGLSDTTIWNYFRVLRAFFAWAHKRGRIDSNPIALAEKPGKPRLLPRAPKEEDVKRLLSYLATEAATGEWPAIRNRALIILALDSGMRRGELARLTPDDLDLVHRTAAIRGGKTKSDRFCALTPFCCQILDNWLKVREQVIGDQETKELFLSSLGRGALTPTGIFRVLKISLERAGAKHFGMHALRHAYAIYSLRNGAVLTDIQKQLGHTNIATTARYLMVDDAGRIERHAATSPLTYLGGPPPA